MCQENKTEKLSEFESPQQTIYDVENCLDLNYHSKQYMMRKIVWI